MLVLDIVAQLLLLLLALTAGAYDLRYRRIPNWLVLSGLLMGFISNFLLTGLPGLGSAAIGMGVAFVIYFPLWLLGGMGAGDVKLMAAIGSIVGWANWLVIFVFSAILGGIFGIVLIIAVRRFRKTFWNIGYILYEMVHFRSPRKSSEELDVRSAKAVRLPHGAVIALGCLLFLGILFFRP